jgi:hypothetical protein
MADKFIALLAYANVQRTHLCADGETVETNAAEARAQPAIYARAPLSAELQTRRHKALLEMASNPGRKRRAGRPFGGSIKKEAALRQAAIKAMKRQEALANSGSG